MKRISFLLLGIAFLGVGSAFAQDEYGEVYVGFGAGASGFEQETALPPPDSTINIDDEAYGLDIFVGYRAQNNFGVEVGYTDFGSVSDSANARNLSFDTDGWTVAGNYTFGDRFLFALNAGWLFAETQVSFCDDGCDKEKFDENGPFLGGALGWRFTDRFALRGTLNYYFIEFEDEDGVPIFDDIWRLGVDVVFKTN